VKTFVIILHRFRDIAGFLFLKRASALSISVIWECFPKTIIGFWCWPVGAFQVMQPVAAITGSHLLAMVAQWLIG